MNIQKLIRAYQIIDGIPTSLLSLETWQARGPAGVPSCKTIACAAGFLAMHPEFSEGIVWVKDPDLCRLYPHIDKTKLPSFPTTEGMEYQDFDMFKHMAEMLDITEEQADSLFTTRRYEEISDFKLKNVSDKEVWKRRAKLLLEESGG